MKNKSTIGQTHSKKRLIELEVKFTILNVNPTVMKFRQGMLKKHAK